MVVITTPTSGYTGDNGSATSAHINTPIGITTDLNGNVIFADNASNVIRMVAFVSGTNFGISMTAGNIYTIAGTGAANYTGDNGAGTSATLHLPQGVAFDSNRNLIITDTGNNVIRILQH